MDPRVGSEAASGSGEPRRLSKNQRRILTVLKSIQPAREQLIAKHTDLNFESVWPARRGSAG